MTPAKVPSLSARLRAGTKSAHRAVESLAFLRAFLRGIVDRDSYCRYLVDFEHVYAQLERGLRENAQHPMLSPLILPVLWRQQSLREDVAFFSRPGAGPLRASSSARVYGDRLRTLADRRPELLVAHAYTRYLGDLSGGPILRRITARAFGLVGDAGLAFYAFPEIADLPSFKLDYRSRLDELPVDEALTEELIAEACRAFELNGAIFKELSGSAAKGLWKLLSHSLSVAKLEPAHDEGAVQTSVLFR